MLRYNLLLFPSPSYSAGWFLRVPATFGSQQNSKIWQIHISKISSTWKTLDIYLWTNLVYHPPTTITHPNYNRNQNNHICSDIDISYRKICNYINCDKCATNFDRTIATTKITNSITTTTTEKTNNNNNNNRCISCNKDEARDSGGNLNISESKLR